MSPVAARAVAEARSWVGTPYHDQASLRGVGADCLGLLRGVWRAVLGPEPMAMPAYTRDWAEASGRETLLEAARAAMLEIAATNAKLDELGRSCLAPGHLVRGASRRGARHGARERPP